MPDRDGPWGRPPRRRWPLGWLALAGGVLALVGVLHLLFPNALAREDNQIDLVYSVLVLAGLASGLIAHWRAGPGRVVRSIVVWIAVALVLVGLYGFRHELRAVAARIADELNPSAPRFGADGAIAVRRASDSHFYLDAKVNGVAIRFLVDTGATSVALTRVDAKRLGFDPDRLDYTLRVGTAGGERWAAPLPPLDFEIGRFRLAGVRAHVSDGGLEDSLLGMTVLSRFRSVAVEGDALTLRP
jgi:aspartyl protease family protein